MYDIGSKIDESLVEKFITDPNISPDFIQFSDEAAEYFVTRHKKEENLTTNQIRNFFGEVKKIQLQIDDKIDKNRLMLLKPRLEYIVAKQSNASLKKLKEIIMPCLTVIISEQEIAKQIQYFEKFTNLLESILAYHKAHGGK